MKVGVIGVGHLGKEHARVYSEIPEVDLAGVFDVDAERAEEIASRYGGRVFASEEDLLDAVDAVSIVVPTIHHFDIATRCIERELPCLVEKPMTATLEEAEELARLVRERDACLQVGHIERFNPAIAAAERYLDHPRFIDCDRISPFSFRSSDIGVVMDLMIHDLDIILHLCSSEVVDVEAVGVNILGKGEDLAHVRLRFEDGGMAVLTASRVALKRMRKMRIFQLDAYVTIDFFQKEAWIYRKRPDFDYGSLDVASLDLTNVGDLGALLFSKFLEIENVEMDEWEPLRRELDAFTEAARNGTPTPVTAEDGHRAIKVADWIMREIRENLKAEVSRLEETDEVELPPID